MTLQLQVEPLQQLWMQLVLPALERSPRHVAAMSGKALSLMGLGRQEEAQEVLREAIRLNPWIPERGLLVTPPDKEL